MLISGVHTTDPDIARARKANPPPEARPLGERERTTARARPAH